MADYIKTLGCKNASDEEIKKHIAACDEASSRPQRVQELKKNLKKQRAYEVLKVSKNVLPTISCRCRF